MRCFHIDGKYTSLAKATDVRAAEVGRTRQLEKPKQIYLSLRLRLSFALGPHYQTTEPQSPPKVVPLPIGAGETVLQGYWLAPSLEFSFSLCLHLLCPLIFSLPWHWFSCFLSSLFSFCFCFSWIPHIPCLEFCNWWSPFFSHPLNTFSPTTTSHLSQSSNPLPTQISLHQHL